MISRGYIEIIHILDQEEKLHINSFDISIGRTTEVQEFITAFIIINRENLTETINTFQIINISAENNI